MTKFLHIADIHLGIRRYRSEARAQDFFEAWRTCLQQYALAEKVSFVLIAGDLFDARRVEPEAMNHAIHGLSMLRDAGIPVIAIEGNHDSHEVTNRFSWLRSLSQWGFLKLLEPVHKDGVLRFTPWDENAREGSFIDIDGVRVFGSSWYGATVSQAISSLADQARTHRSENRFNIMMLHTDVEGQLNRPIPALSIAKLNELRPSIDYLALGHTHKNFEIGDWAYNPGSLEACSVDEYEHKRGAYLVELADGRHQAQLVRGYTQRPIVRINHEVTGVETPEEFREAVLSALKRDLQPQGEEKSELAPVVELTIAGKIGFKPALLEVNRLKDEIEDEFQSLLALVRNQTVPVEYAGPDKRLPHAELERRVIEDLISRDSRFSDRSSELAQMLLELKRLALTEEPPSEILRVAEQHLSRA
jgi:DNA repair protein SbcD/Mre11